MDVSQSLFYWITYSYKMNIFVLMRTTSKSLNPYFIGLPILILEIRQNRFQRKSSQSLFYWITYSYNGLKYLMPNIQEEVSILILLDYLFL